MANDPPVPKSKPTKADKRYGTDLKTGGSVSLADDPTAPPVGIDLRSDKQKTSDQSDADKRKAYTNHIANITRSVDALSEMLGAKK